MRTAGQLCRELNIRYYRLDYLIRNGYVPKPKRLDSGQRIFSDEDIEKIKQVIIERRQLWYIFTKINMFNLLILIIYLEKKNEFICEEE